MSSITRQEALQLVNQYSNQPKCTYVRVVDRKVQEGHDIEGMPGYRLVLHTTVWSKSWSKTSAPLWYHVGNSAIELRTLQAKKMLA
jgi:hypothetical protein